MRKKGGTSKTRIEKSSIPRSINPRATRRGVVGVTITSGDVHVANNNLVFCCYICICCLKLHQANYHVEEFWIIFFIFLWVGGWRRRGGGVSRYGGGALHPAPMYLLFGAVYCSPGRRGYFGVSNVVLVYFDCMNTLYEIWFICIKDINHVFMDHISYFMA